MGRVPDSAVAGPDASVEGGETKEERVNDAVQIAVDGRHEAVGLMDALIPFHSFVVQLDREHWVVHARVPGAHGETLDELFATIERWQSRAGVRARASGRL